MNGATHGSGAKETLGWNAYDLQGKFDGIASDMFLN